MIVQGKATERVTLSSNERSKKVLRLYSVVILGTSMLVPALLLGRAFLNFRNQSFLSYASGVWLTLAFDWTHGVLYRPLLGPLGYGGTRYFPLYFVLTGSLSKIFGSLETSGLILSAGSVILLSYGCYVLLRRLDVSVLLSLAAVPAVLMAATTQQALLETRGDGLAAMLNLWGVTLCIGPKAKRGLLYLAAVLFGLAFAAKLTTVFGVAAVILGWVLSRRYREAWQLGLAAFSAYVLVLSAIYFGSEGRAVEVFRACATGGGSLIAALKGPLHMVGVALEADPVMLLVLIPAAALAPGYFKERPSEILPIYFAAVLLTTMVIFGSPGTFANHLLDLHVAAVLLFAFSVSRSAVLAEIGTGILALNLLVGCIPSAHTLRNDLGRSSFRAEIQKVLENLPRDDRPTLAENPFVVLKSGKTPYVLDPFSFRVATNKRPALGRDLWEKITHKGFSAIILQGDPRSARAKEWYGEGNFGGEFLDDVETNYSFNYKVGGLYVYTPKQTEP